MTIENWITIGVAVGLQVIAIFVWMNGWMTRFGNRVAVLENQMAVFWKNVSFDAAKILHSPDPAHWRMDQLIERYWSGEITLEERGEMIMRLQDKLDNHELPKDERITAAIMLRAFEQVSGYIS